MYLIPSEKYLRLVKKSTDTDSSPIETVREVRTTIPNENTNDVHPPDPSHPVMGAEGVVLDRDLILAFLPCKMKRKACSILSFLRWNARGEILEGDACISGSHVVDLLKSMIYPRHDITRIKGVDVVCRTLLEANAPGTLVCNELFRKRMRGLMKDADFARRLESVSDEDERRVGKVISL